MPTTPTKRAEANAKNARHSTGPRTVEGKARSSRNALKHGLTSKAVVLPNEDPAAFDEALDQWNDYYQPEGPAEAAMIERAVVSKWRLDRCARVETGRLAERVRHADERYDFERFAEAEVIGRRLIHDPICRRDFPQESDPVYRAAAELRRSDNPAVLSRQLQMTPQGVDWLTARWAELAAMLESHGHWLYPEKFRALWLLGKSPEEVAEDALVRKLYLACSASNPDDPDCMNLYNECYQGKYGQAGRSPDYYQVRNIRLERPADADAARAELREILTAEVARLAALKRDLLDPRDRLDRADAAEAAMFDDTPEGALLRRYEAGHERAFHKSVADLLRLRKEPVLAPDAPEPEPPLRNEPIAETPAAADLTPEPDACTAPDEDQEVAPVGEVNSPGKRASITGTTSNPGRRTTDPEGSGASRDPIPSVDQVPIRSDRETNTGHYRRPQDSEVSRPARRGGLTRAH